MGWMGLMGVMGGVGNQLEGEPLALGSQIAQRVGWWAGG